MFSLSIQTEWNDVGLWHVTVPLLFVPFFVVVVHEQSHAFLLVFVYIYEVCSILLYVIILRILLCSFRFDVYFAHLHVHDFVRRFEGYLKQHIQY